MQAPPAAPLLERGASGLVVTFTPPKGVANAALYLHEGGAKRFYCTAARAVLAAGTSGSMLTVQARGVQHQIVVSDGLAEGKTSATICYRAANAMDCGPESPHSNTLELARPPAPCAPKLTPSARRQIKVAFALPALSFRASVKVEAGGVVHRVEVSKNNEPGALVPGLPTTLNSLATSPSAHAYSHYAQTSGQGHFLLTLPANDVEYSISVAAFNGVAWSDFGPTTKIRLLDQAPRAPAAPVVSKIGEDSVCVHFTSPPQQYAGDNMVVSVAMAVVPGGPVLYYNSKDHRLISTTDPNFDEKRSPCQFAKLTSCVVQGLAPNTEYQVNILAGNLCGWGDASPGVKFKTLRSEVEVTGVQTQDERDAEAKKRAVDVDAADEPEAKRAK